MSIEVKCSCGTRLRAPNRMIGKAATCGGCSKRLVVMPLDRDKAARLLARIQGESQDRWIRTDCGRCQKRIKAPSSWRGRKGHCPRCNAQVTMGESTAPAQDRDQATLERRRQRAAAQKARQEADWIRQDCEGCGKRIKAPLSWVGKKGNCPRCGIAVVMGEHLLADPTVDVDPTAEAEGEISLDVDPAETGYLDEDAIVDTIKAFVDEREQTQADDSYEDFEDLEPAQAHAEAEARPHVSHGDRQPNDQSGLMSLYEDSFGESFEDQEFSDLAEGQLPVGPELQTETYRQKLIRERAHAQRLARLHREHIRDSRKYRRLSSRRQSFRLMLLKEQIDYRAKRARAFVDRERTTISTMAVCVMAVCILFNAWIWIFAGNEQANVKMPQAYFYDLNTGELFVEDANLTPPIKAPSGTFSPAGMELDIPAGVRAHLFTCTGCKDDAETWLGYLELYDARKQEALALLQQGKPVANVDVGRRDRQSTAPLISGPETLQWVRADEPGALAIVESISNRCLGGKPLRCDPPPRIVQ